MRKLTNGWWINDAVRSLVLGPELGRVSAGLMQVERIRLWHDQVVWKPPTVGGDDPHAGNIGWHQDYAYWNCTDTTKQSTNSSTSSSTTFSTSKTTSNTSSSTYTCL